MLTTRITIRQIVLFFAASVWLGLTSIYGNNEPSAPDAPENPFGSGKVTGGDGGTPPCLDFPCLTKKKPTFHIMLDGIENGSFPCDLAIGVTDLLGNTVYIDLDIEDFVPHAPCSEFWVADIQHPDMISHVLKDAVECRDGVQIFPYVLEMLCKSTNPNGQQTYSPIEYCGNDNPWSIFLRAFLLPNEDCEAQEYNGVSGIVEYKLCCESGPSEPVFDGEGTSVHTGPNDRPLSRDNSSDFDVYANFNSTSVVINRTTSKSHQVFLTDMAGRTVYQSTNSQQSYDIDHNGLQPGLYFVTVYTNGHASTKKIVVQ